MVKQLVPNIGIASNILPIAGKKPFDDEKFMAAVTDWPALVALDKFSRTLFKRISLTPKQNKIRECYTCSYVDKDQRVCGPVRRGKKIFIEVRCYKRKDCQSARAGKCATSIPWEDI